MYIVVIFSVPAGCVCEYSDPLVRGHSLPSQTFIFWPGSIQLVCLVAKRIVLHQKLKMFAFHFLTKFFSSFFLRPNMSYSTWQIVLPPGNSDLGFLNHTHAFQAFECGFLERGKKILGIIISTSTFHCFYKCCFPCNKVL